MRKSWYLFYNRTTEILKVGESILGQHFLTELKRSLLIPVNLENRINTCCSSYSSEILSALQNTHNLSFRGIFENLPVSIANLWLFILILMSSVYIPYIFL